MKLVFKLDKNDKSIKAKITGKVVRIVTTMLVFTGIGLGAVSTGFFLHQSSGRQETEALALKENINAWYEMEIKQVDTLAAAIENMGVTAEDIQKPILKPFLRECLLADETVYDFYYCAEDDRAVFAGDWEPTPDEYQPTTREWYQKAKETDSVYFSDPYVDADSGKVVITFAKAVKNEGKVIGVLAADFFADELNVISQKLFDSSHRYAVLVAEDGTIIVHDDPELAPSVDKNGNVITMQYSDAGISSKLIGVNTLTTGVGSGLRHYTASYAEVAELSVIAVSDWWSFYGGISIFAISAIVVITVFIILSRTLMSAATEKYLSPMSEIKDFAGKMAKGDLSFVANYRENDEIGEACIAIEESNVEMRKYLADVSEKLERMAGGDFTTKVDMKYRGDFKSLKDSINNISAALSDSFGKLSNAANNVHDSASNVANHADNLLKDVEGVGTLVSEAEDSVKKVEEEFAESRKVTNNSIELADSSKAGIEKSQSNMDDLLKAMDIITEKSKSIADIIEIIENIASETNLLSLNASIEAARAGDAGRGFAVVADSVRALSEQTAQAAANTSQLINETVAAVHEGSRLVSISADSMKEIIEKNDEVNAEMKKIVEAIDKESVIVNEMAESFNEVAGLTDNTSKTSEECVTLSNELYAQVEDMYAIIGQFKI